MATLSTDKRLEFTDKTKAQAFERSGRRCEMCGVNLRDGAKKQFDHRQPDFYKGSNHLENCQVLCVPCHGLKCKDEAPQMAKSRRMIRKAAGVRARKLTGKPLAGTKASGLRKRMNGDVETW